MTTLPPDSLDQTQAMLMAQRLLWAERDVNRSEQRARDAAQAVATALHSQRVAERETQAEIGRSNELRAQLAMVYASTSWKFARPVRAFYKVRQAVQKLLGSAPPPPQAQPLPPCPPHEPSLLLQSREQAIMNRLLGHD